MSPARKPLRRVSAKRERDNTLRADVLATVRRRDGDRCWAKDIVGEVRCSWPLDGHEIIPRARWPRGWLEPENVRLICRAHHDWIHDHPVEATARGLLERYTPTGG